MRTLYGDRCNLAGSTCCHLTTRERNARNWRIHVYAGQREPKRGGCRSPRVTRPPQTPPPPPPPLPLRATPRRAVVSGLLWRGRLDATSREYLTPVVPSAPASRGPMARRRRRRRYYHHHHHRLTTATADPYSTSPCCILPTDTRPGSLARSLARSRVQTIAPFAFRTIASSSVLFPPSPLSAYVPEASPLPSPSSPSPPRDSFLPPFSFPSPFRLTPRFYAGCLVPTSSRSLSLSFSSSPFATPGVSRCLDAALR